MTVRNRYPVMLNIVDRTCVIVGGGQVGVRKARSLLEAGARVVVISPALDPTFGDLMEHSNLKWIEATYNSDLLAAQEPFLVFAATDSADVNIAAGADARQLGALVNVVDKSAPDDFDNMPSIQRPPITIGISTGGASPVLAKLLKGYIEQFISNEYVTLSRWLGELRPQLKSQIESSDHRHAFYQQVLESDVMRLLREGQIGAAHAQFQTLFREHVGS